MSTCKSVYKAGESALLFVIHISKGVACFIGLYPVSPCFFFQG